MPSPLGYSHITSRGPRGWFARRWLRHRVHQIVRAQARMEKS